MHGFPVSQRPVRSTSRIGLSAETDGNTIVDSLRAAKSKAVAEEDFLLANQLKEEIEKFESGSVGNSFQLFSQRAIPLFSGDSRLPPMVECPCVLPGTSLKALVKPPDADGLWQWYEALGNLDADPSWAEVWPTAASLAEALVADPNLVVDMHVAELGSGLGVAGLAACALGAQSVSFFDREPHALHCAMATAALNGFPTTDTIGRTIGGTAANRGVGAALLDWSPPNSQENSKSANLETYSGRFDVVVASDVLYDLETVPGFVDATLVLLSKHRADDPDSKSESTNDEKVDTARAPGLVLVTDPETERSPGCRAAFVSTLEEAGATVEVVPLPPVASTTAASSSYSPVGCPERTVLISASWE